MNFINAKYYKYEIRFVIEEALSFDQASNWLEFDPILSLHVGCSLEWARGGRTQAPIPAQKNELQKEYKTSLKN